MREGADGVGDVQKDSSTFGDAVFVASIAVDVVAVITILDGVGCAVAAICYTQSKGTASNAQGHRSGVVGKGGSWW